MLYSIFHRFIILVLIFCRWTRKFCSLACAKIELNENRKTSAELPLLCCRCLVYRNTNVQFVYLFVLSPATQNRFQCIHIVSSSVYFAMWPLLFHVYLHSCVIFSYSIFRNFFDFPLCFFFWRCAFVLFCRMYWNKRRLYLCLIGLHKSLITCQFMKQNSETSENTKSVVYV